MDPPEYQKTEGDTPSEKKLPPYDFSDQQPLPISGSSPTTTGFVTYTPLPYPPQYGPQGTDPGQPPQAIALVVPVQPTHERDYLAYSIFSTVCCFLPLGVVALIYSIKTRDANRIGDSVTAQQSSRMVRIFAHTAVAVGLLFLIVYIVLIVLLEFKF